MKKLIIPVFEDAADIPVLLRPKLGIGITDLTPEAIANQIYEFIQNCIKKGWSSATKSKYIWIKVIQFDRSLSPFFGEKLYRIGKAAQQLGVSIPTVRNWIYSGKVQTLHTAGGEHRIPESEIRRILGIPAPKRQPVIYSRVSSYG